MERKSVWGGRVGYPCARRWDLLSLEPLREWTGVGSTGKKTQKQLVSHSSFHVNLPINIWSRIIFTVLLIFKLQCLFMKKYYLRKTQPPQNGNQKIMFFEWLKSWLSWALKFHFQLLNISITVQYGGCKRSWTDLKTNSNKKLWSKRTVSFSIWRYFIQVCWHKACRLFTCDYEIKNHY